MVRRQVQFTEEQAVALTKLAERQECSVSELVRQAVADLLRQNDEAEAEKWRRASAVVGMFSSGLGDLAERHDDYLDEIYGT